MTELTIKNETVYVIYRNGEPYSSKGKKLVYTTKGAANGVITNESKELAVESVVDGTRNRKLWWDLSKGEQDEIVDRIRNEFEVVEYKRSK